MTGSLIAFHCPAIYCHNNPKPKALCNYTAEELRKRQSVNTNQGSHINPFQLQVTLAIDTFILLHSEWRIDCWYPDITYLRRHPFCIVSHLHHFNKLPDIFECAAKERLLNDVDQSTQNDSSPFL